MLSTSKTRNPLDLTGEDFSAMMAEIIPDLCAFLDRLPQAGISFRRALPRFSAKMLLQCFSLLQNMDGLFEGYST